MQKITPFLMFAKGAEEAAQLYTSLFEDSKITSVGRGPDGVAQSVNFTLKGQPFMAFNGGPHFSFSEGMSLFVSCESQAEIDRLWTKLTSEGGQDSQCGWVKDRFGVSWQLVPVQFMQMMGDPDRAKAGRAVQAMLTMRKLDVAALQKAFDGR